MKRRAAWLWTALFFSAMSPACDGGGGETTNEQICEPGTEVFCRPCEGNPDEKGTKTCNADGTGFDACVAQTGECPIIECTPGESRFCKCDDGGAGEKVCNDEGTGYTACECGGGVTCTPGDTLFCTCDDGAAGEKACNEDGSSYSACACGGSGGGESGGRGSGGGAPGKPLLSPCLQGDECESGSCPMGYCTKDCTKVSDCPFGAAECVTFDGASFCMPTCKDQSDCNVYGSPSECGYTPAIDDFPVTTCADWLGDLAVPPDGHPCMGDTDCNLGHVGKELVCTFETCTTGCFVDEDCAGAQTCSSNGSTIGSCE